MGDCDSRQGDVDKLGIWGAGGWRGDITVVQKVKKEGVCVIGVHVVYDAGADSIVPGGGGGGVDVWARGAGGGGCHRLYPLT